MKDKKDLELSVVAQDVSEFLVEDVLDIEDWDTPINEKFPPVHVATLGGKKLYARKLTVKDKSTIAKVLVLNRNEPDFTIFAKIIGTIALDENGGQFFKTQSQKDKILDRDYETIMKLYMKIISVADEDTYNALKEQSQNNDNEGSGN